MLDVQDFHVHYYTSRGAVEAVNGVTFSNGRGERRGLVAGFGSGKSTIAKALMRLICPPGRIESGEVVLDGPDSSLPSREEMRRAWDCQQRCWLMLMSGRMTREVPPPRADATFYPNRTNPRSVTRASGMTERAMNASRPNGESSGLPRERAIDSNSW